MGRTSLALPAGSHRSAPSKRTASKRTASEPIKILHVLGYMWRAGIQLRTLELLRHVDPRRYQFHICSLSGCSGELDEEVRALGGTVHLMRRSLPGFPWRFRRLLRRHQFHVVHAHMHYVSGYLLRLAAQCGTPLRVAHFRSSHVSRASTSGPSTYRKVRGILSNRCATQPMMRRWIDRWATDILGVSGWSLTRAWRPDWSSDPRCRVVYDGLEVSSLAGERDAEGVRREFGLPGDVPLYVHVGRMTEAKNHPRLISIFSEVLRRQPAARLLLVGRSDKAIESQLQSRIATLGVGNRVVFAGERADVPRLLKAADLMVFPSLWEGLGDVVLEACAVGTPTLASSLPSIHEIAAQLPGVRCLSLDEPDAQWADLAVEMSHAPPSDRDRQIALQTFSNSVFTVEKCTAALCQIWQDGLARRHTGGVVDA